MNDDKTNVQAQSINSTTKTTLKTKINQKKIRKPKHRKDEQIINNNINNNNNNNNNN